MIAEAIVLVASQAALYVAALAAGLEWKGRRAHPERGERFDYAVVLGCKLREDGAPTRTLERRVALGARIVLEERAERLVLSGGRVGRARSEADAALATALALGLARERIVLEEGSRSTEENAREVAALLADPSASILVVTDAYHVPRSTRLFSRHFRKVRGVGVPDRGLSRAKNAVREALVVISYLARGKLD